MHRFLASIVIFVFFTRGFSFAQVLPGEGSKLHYRIIGFSVPGLPGTKNDTLEVAEGNFSNPDSFGRHIIYTTKCNSGKIVAEVPYFGKDYTWRIKAHGMAATQLHHFSTISLPSPETNKIRLAVLQSPSRYKDAFVFSDAAKILYDMQGNPVWVMPEIAGIVTDKTIIRDLKISDAGTITFMTMTMAYEMDFNGNILWKAPNNGEGNGEKNEHYHHELTRLHNGHYMVLGNELVGWRWQVDEKGDSSVVPIGEKQASPSGEKKAFQAPFGMVLEYDATGKLVWVWRYSEYFLQNYASKKGLRRSDLDCHENAFFFDEKGKAVYVSFKNSSQVLKVHYPQGNVEEIYGQNFLTGAPSYFCQQHACKIAKDGSLYLFNNNFCNPDSLPSVVMLGHAAKSGWIKKIWEYKCPVRPGDFKKQAATTGGNVMELPGGELFVSMCAPYGNMFIVGKDKHKLWDAILEKWDTAENRWTALDQYRASIITSRGLLEQLIWNARGL